MVKTLQKIFICIVVSSGSAGLQAQPFISNDTLTNVTCNGLNNGAISYHIDGTSGPIHYSWNNGTSGYATGGCTYAVNLNNPGTALTQFQVRVDVNLAAGMNADFSNIVFLDSTGNQFSFWLKDFPTAGSATFWVRVPFIPAGPSVFYLSFCGNSTTSASSGPNTFEFFDNFDNGDFSTWTSNCIFPIAGASCNAQASSTQFYSPGFSANLAANSTCFIPPYSGSGATISRTITIVNDSLVVDYNDLIQAMNLSYCPGSTGTRNNIFADGNDLGQGASVGQNGCGTSTSNWADETSQPFAVVAGSTTLMLQTYSGDCDQGQGWFDDVRIRKYVSNPPLATLDTTGQLYLNNLAAGTYIIHLSDVNGGSAIDTFIISSPSPLLAVTDSSNIKCFGVLDGQAWVNVTGGTKPIQFSWSNSQTTDTISNLSAGSYFVTVTDSNGCSTSSLVQIPPPASAFQIAAGDSGVACFGTNTGSAWTIVSGGETPYNYSWSNGQTTDTITGLTASKYIIVVTDMNGCSLTDSVVITQPASALNVTTGSQAGLCAGLAQGVVWANPQGGSTPYSYIWSNNQTTDTIANLNPGTYSVTVSDINHCQSINSVVLSSANQALSISLSAANPSCFNSNNGVVAASISGGTLPYSFKWSPPVSSNDSALNLAAGQYVVNVLDSNKCPVADSVNLSQPTAITFTNSILNATCNNSVPDAVTIRTSGGGQPLHFSWTPPVSTTDSASAISAGTYIINITDSNNCSAAPDTVLINQPATLKDSIIQNNNVCAPNSNAIQVFAGGGTAPYLFIFSNNIQNSTGIADSLPAGIFYFSITDANNCQIADSVILPSSDSINLMVEPATAEINMGQTLQITSTSSQVNLTYKWSPQQDLSCYDCPNPLFSGNNSQNYRLEVSDASGCSASAEISIAVNADYNLFFPNIFSPNGDGKNDTWKILGNIEAVKYVDVTIFNRIGEKVYESNDVLEGWDGKYKGQAAQPGVYVFVAKILWVNEYSERIKMGTLTVAR